jgi:hypothetical protein
MEPALTQPQYRLLDKVARGHVRRTATGIDCEDRRRQTPPGYSFVSGRGSRIRTADLAAAGLAVLNSSTSTWELTPSGVAVHAAWLAEEQAAKGQMRAVLQRSADGRG